MRAFAGAIAGRLGFMNMPAMSVFLPLVLKKFFGVFFEFGEAVLAAKVIGPAVVCVIAGSAVRIHSHSAHWVNSHE
jgi:hypothetical protein